TFSSPSACLILFVSLHLCVSVSRLLDSRKPSPAHQIVFLSACLCAFASLRQSCWLSDSRSASRLVAFRQPLLQRVEFFACEAEDQFVEEATACVDMAANAALGLAAQARGVVDHGLVALHAADVVLLEAQFVKGIAQHDDLGLKAVAMPAMGAVDARAGLEGTILAVHGVD